MVSVPLAVSLPVPAPPRPATFPPDRAYRTLHAAYTALMTPTAPGLFDRLRAALLSREGEELTLTFAALERLLGAALPDDAWLRAWWANDPRSPRARAWLAAGWRVRWVRRSGDEAAVTFSRSPVPTRPVPGARRRPPP